VIAERRRNTYSPLRASLTCGICALGDEDDVGTHAHEEVPQLRTAPQQLSGEDRQLRGLA
jgi:hypothetical protein